jgi:DNA-binding Lrp family transcriptional regulator
MELSLDDVAILKSLQRDARLSYRDIAKKTGVSTPTVSSRVETFKELGLIRGFTIKSSTEHLNEITILLEIETKPSDVDTIVSRLQVREEIKELYILDGAIIHGKVTVIDNGSLLGILEELRSIPEINSFTYRTITETSKEEPRTTFSEGLTVTIPCYYCRKPIHDDPVKLKLDGKDHYLCCTSCSALYEEKYNKMKQAADDFDQSSMRHQEH